MAKCYLQFNMRGQLKKGIIEVKWKLVGILGRFIIDLLFFTTRIESIGYEKLKPIFSSRRMICAFWHSRILLPSYLHKGLNAVILVSGSEDGEIIARIVQNQGHETIRGSTTRGGHRAIAGMIKTIKEQRRPGVVIPDGPLGPRFKAQAGVITLAKKTGYPIIPISYSARRIKVFHSWDRFILPYPFTKCRVVYGDPVYVPGEADREEEKRCRFRLEKELRRLTFEADRYYGHNIT